MSARTVALLAVGVLAVSVSGPVTAAVVMPPLVIAFWRNALATGVLAVPVVTGRRADLAVLGSDRRQLGLAVTAGVCLAVHFGFWVTSLTMTSVASSVAILSLQVVWVVAWDALTGAPAGHRVLLGVLVAVAGAVVVGGLDLTISARALLGDAFALVGSIAVAAYTIIGARARRTLSTTAYTFACYASAALALLVALLAAGDSLTGYGRREWVLVVVITLTAQLLGHSVFIHLLDTISPMMVSLALLLEIPGAALLAAAWLGQVPGPGAVAGLVLILAGMAAVILAAPDTPPVVEGA